MKRPPLTTKRIAALRKLADVARARAGIRANAVGLFAFPTEVRDEVRQAIKYIDDLVEWHTRPVKRSEKAARSSAPFITLPSLPALPGDP